jgi:4-hydroxy-tetrahydrodipicolinate synthase
MPMTSAQLKERIKGMIHLVMTHFDEEDRLDDKAVRAGLRHAVEALKGQDAVFLATGSTAEFYALGEEENKQIIRTVVEEVGGSFPVIVGTGRPGTRLTIEMSQFAQTAGADGVLVVSPYYQPTTLEGLLRHFRLIAKNIDIGIMIYNNSVASKLWIPPDLMARLAKIENIVADKENAASAPAYYAMRRAVDPADMVIVAGLGHLMFSFEALYGCPAFVTELVNFAPQLAIAINNAATARDYPTLTSLVDQIAPYYDFLARCAQRRSPVPAVLSPALPVAELPLYQSVIKTAMSLIGLPGGRVREPMENLTDTEKEELREVLRSIGICR